MTKQKKKKEDEGTRMKKSMLSERKELLTHGMMMKMLATSGPHPQSSANLPY